jgi:hypothetical protein
MLKETDGFIIEDTEGTSSLTVHHVNCDDVVLFLCVETATDAATICLSDEDVRDLRNHLNEIIGLD